MKGKEIPENNIKIEEENRAIPSYPGDGFLVDAINKLSQKGLTLSQVAQYFNEKGIPSKQYPVKLWNEILLEDLINKHM